MHGSPGEYIPERLPEIAVGGNGKGPLQPGVNYTVRGVP